MDEAVNPFAEAPKPKRVRKPAKKKVAVRKQARKPSASLLPCRMDLRVTRAERAKVAAKAKALRRTITSIVRELIEKMK